MEMSALDFILLNDPSGVEIEQKEIPEGGPSIVRRTEHVRIVVNLESVPIQPIMDGSSTKKLHVPIRRSTRGASSPNVVPQSTDPISVDSGHEDDTSVIASVTRVKLIKKEVSEASYGAGDAPGLKICIVLKKLNETKRSVPEKVVSVSSGAKAPKLVLKKKVKGGSFKPASPKEVFMVKKEKIVAKDGVKDKVEGKMEMVVKENVEVDKGKGPVKADLPVFVPQWKLKEDMKWLIGSGIRGFVTCLLHSQEFNLHLAGIYSKVMAHGRHTGLVAGVDAASRGEAVEKLPAYKPDSLPDFVDAVKTMEVLSYPYLEALSQIIDCPIVELKALELEGLNKELCEQLLSVASIKRALFETSDEEGGDASPSSKRLKVTPKPE
ncbi:hypothetical protein HanXRQr2_Chr05g0210861 [Helianthus annuus]|uniref:Uncharacterized protein n=1 Tax=Helianthus annuus TaxID=4232 RepID=A0A9K3NM01_HELAN|nr:hypothetical protein HanXRQr2_Chr05g0210861 [Helianthus annuus]KAJ0569981.1 hypothetical protein HanHA300_Chr05g0172821 [Helianthus annuus]